MPCSWPCGEEPGLPASSQQQLLPIPHQQLSSTALLSKKQPTQPAPAFRFPSSGHVHTSPGSKPSTSEGYRLLPATSWTRSASPSTQLRERGSIHSLTSAPIFTSADDTSTYSLLQQTAPTNLRILRHETSFTTPRSHNKTFVFTPRAQRSTTNTFRDLICPLKIRILTTLPYLVHFIRLPPDKSLRHNPILHRFTAHILPPLLAVCHGLT
jgi:hypothetical protein